MPSEYDRGYAAGLAARDHEVEGLRRVADYWYARACNPNAKTFEQKVIDSLITGMQENEERDRKRAELDAIDAAKFERARVLIGEGLDDVTIAMQVELFVPTVENIRAGAL
jgi:hypothetical protein